MICAGPPSKARERALKEVARHISGDNISQWNRSIGRLLDTGLSELGLHFILEKSSLFSDLISRKDSSVSELTLEDDVAEYVRDISSIFWKLRSEHFHLLVLCLCSLPHRSDGTVVHLRVDTALYPIHLHPAVIKIVVEGLLSTYQASFNETSEAKKKVIGKPKGLIRKLGQIEAENDSGAPLPLALEETLSPETPATELEVVKSPSLVLLESVLDFNSLFLLLPAHLHQLIRDSFSQLRFLQELTVELLISLECSEEQLMNSVQILIRHCGNRLEASFPTQDILTASMGTLLQYMNSQTHRSSHSPEDWKKLLEKVNQFLIMFKLSPTDFWTQYLDFFLRVEPSHVQKGLEEYHDLFCNRYDFIESLYETSALSWQSTLPTQSTLKLYFKTHIFLLSSDVLPLSKMIFLPCGDSEQQSLITLPFTLESFSSSDSLIALFHVLSDHLRAGLALSQSPERSRKVVMVLTHLLRLWGWGSRPLSSHQKIQQLFELWNQKDLFTADSKEEEEEEEPRQEEGQLLCFISLLDLCSQNNLHEDFLDLFLLDLCCPSLRSRNLKELRDRMPLILELTCGFREDLSAWVLVIAL
jgi:hypothetical protein